MVLCPADITSELAADPVTWDATATDNSEMIANLTSSPSTSDVVLGTNTVTVIAMDPSGNKAECSFVVILTGGLDACSYLILPYTGISV